MFIFDTICFSLTLSIVRRFFRH